MTHLKKVNEMGKDRKLGSKSSRLLRNEDGREMWRLKEVDKGSINENKELGIDK
jgi:hypothetical protein